MTSVSDIDTGEAALAASYDRIPYDSQPFPDARPAYLAGLARLHGLRPAMPSHCRVLELGCASGGHLIPLAWRYPDSEFVGIDLSAEQIRQGNAMVAALNLPNCTLHAGDLTRFEIDDASYDYVIAHGLYSWVPERVRAAILPLCRRALRPGGIAYISYNTLPGWRMRGLTRDLLDWHLRDIGDPLDRLQAAQALMDRLAAGMHGQAPSSYLEMEVRRIRSRPPSYLAHEFLEPDNRAFLLHEFATDAAAAGLRYLCNADLATGFAELYDDLGDVMAELADDPLVLEQYLDFVSNRAFRQTLLCRDDEPRTRLDHGRMEQLYLVGGLVPPPKLDLRRAKGQPFTSPDGSSYEVHHPLCKAALAVLHAAYPRGLRYGELLAAAAARVRAQGDVRLAGEIEVAFGELFGLVIMQHIELLPESPLPAPLRVAEPARVNVLARRQAELGWSHLATLTHRSLELDPFARALIGMLDGRRAQTELVAAMSDFLSAQTPPADDAARRRLQRQAEANVARLLTMFARHGVLEPGPG